MASVILTVCLSKDSVDICDWFFFPFSVFKTSLLEIKIVKAVFNFYFSFIQERYIGKKAIVTGAKW